MSVLPSRPVLVMLLASGLIGSGLLVARPSLYPAPTSLASPRSPAPSQQPCTAYAAPHGSDSGTGSAHQPFRTVPALLRALPEGGTGCLLDGTYTGDVTLLRDRTTLRSAPGDRARLVLRVLTIPAAVSGGTVSHVDVVGNDGGVTVRAVGDGFTLERNDITNNHRGASCVLIGASDHRTVGGAVRANVIHGCGTIGEHLHHGIYAQNVGRAAGPRIGAGLLVEHNVVYDVAGYAVQLYPHASSVVLRRNVIDGGGTSVRGGIVIDGPGSWGNTIEENVIARTRTGAVVQRTGAGHVSRGNCLWGNRRGVTGSTIVSTDDRESTECWLADDVWARTGQQAAAEPTGCGARRATPCSSDRAAALCRRLALHAEGEMR